MTLENFRNDKRLQNILFDDDLLAMNQILNENNWNCNLVFKMDNFDEYFFGLSALDLLSKYNISELNYNKDYCECTDLLELKSFNYFWEDNRDYYIFDEFIDFLKCGKVIVDYSSDYVLDLNSDLVDYIKDLLESEGN